MNNDYILYLDMDGVLVDLSSGYRKRTNKSISPGGMMLGDQIPELKNLDASAKFWATLDWMPGGKQLYRAARKLFKNVRILSSAGTYGDIERGKKVELGKRAWVKINIPDMDQKDVFIVPSKYQKPNYADKKSILVDDMALTIRLWNQAGGYGIIHDYRDYRATIEELEDITNPMGLQEIIDEIVDSYFENGLPISGEEKYSKQEPGGTMSAVNLASIEESPKDIENVCGDCFNQARKWALHHDDGKTNVVHGKITNAEQKTFDHAWVEQKGNVIDPSTGAKVEKEKWYAWLHAKPEAIYTATQASVNMVRSGNQGPWTKEETEGRYVWRADGDKQAATEIKSSDIKSRHPYPAMPQKWENDKEGIPANVRPDMDMMTIENLKALRDKAVRGWKYYSKKGDHEGAQDELQWFMMFDKELKKRIKYINAPVMDEAKKKYSDKDNYYKNLSDDEKDDLANQYFSIGQEDDETKDNNFCWIWDGTRIIAKKGGTHGHHFSHEVADANFKGWYDVEKNTVSIVFPDYELRKLSGRRPTVDDIPQNVYTALINKFGKRTPNFVVFEGFGAGNPEEDPLHIPGERWRINWAKRKTPKMAG